MTMRTRIYRGLRLPLLLALCTMFASCEEPRIYGSVGYSSWGSGGFGTSVSIGGRIH